jgi:hypothetical protein
MLSLGVEAERRQGHLNPLALDGTESQRRLGRLRRSLLGRGIGLRLLFGVGFRLLPRGGFGLLLGFGVRLLFGFGVCL